MLWFDRLVMVGYVMAMSVTRHLIGHIIVNGLEYVNDNDRSTNHANDYDLVHVKDNERSMIGAGQ